MYMYMYLSIMTLLTLLVMKYMEVFPQTNKHFSHLSGCPKIQLKSDTIYLEIELLSTG